KGQQIDVSWSRDEIRALRTLLDEARDAGRRVVMASDHGHVLDWNTIARVQEGCEARWRSDKKGAPAPDEVRISGSRVILGGGKLIAPWSEAVRYRGKQNGYHGGLTPQEMIAPIVVLSAARDCAWQACPGRGPRRPRSRPAAPPTPPRAARRVGGAAGRGWGGGRGRAP